MLTLDEEAMQRKGGHPDQAFGCTTYAQHGEDIMILNIFNLIGISRPSYLDVGAHHPFNISNTALLYERGSRGINVEPNPHLIPAFHKFRPYDKNICAAIGPVRGTEKLFMVDHTSGRNSLFKSEVESFCESHPEFKITDEIDVDVITINDIPMDAPPDFLSVDIEGMDCLVIQSMEFKPKVICIELKTHNQRSVVDYSLSGKGYFFYCRMGDNYIFIQDCYYDRVSI